MSSSLKRPAAPSLGFLIIQVRNQQKRIEELTRHVEKLTRERDGLLKLADELEAQVGDMAGEVCSGCSGCSLDSLAQTP